MPVALAEVARTGGLEPTTRAEIVAASRALVEELSATPGEVPRG